MCVMVEETVMQLPSAGTKRTREDSLAIDFTKRPKLCLTPREDDDDSKDDSAPSTSSPCSCSSFEDSEVDSDASRLDALDSSTFLSQSSLADTSVGSFSSLEEDEPEGEQEIEDEDDGNVNTTTPSPVVEARSLQRAVDEVEPAVMEEGRKGGDISDRQFMEDIGRSQYRIPIDRFTLSREPDSWPQAEYLDNRANVTLENRRELFIWMGEALAHFRCHSETHMLAFSIMHRFLSAVPGLPLSRLQLAGVTVLFLALKFAEGGGVDLRQFVEELLPQNKDNSTEDVLEMEKEILAAIEWDLNCPLPIHFLVSFWDGVDPPVGFSMKQAWFLSLYVVELMMAEASLLQFSPSTVAAAAMYVVRLLAAICKPQRESLWTPHLQQVTRKNSQQLGDCVQEMIFLLQQEARYLQLRDNTNISPATFTYQSLSFESVSIVMARIILSPRPGN